MSSPKPRAISARLHARCVKASQGVQSLLARSRLEAARTPLTDEAIASLRTEGVYMTTVERLLGEAAPACRAAMADAAALLQGGPVSDDATWIDRGASTDLAPGELLARLPELFLFGLQANVLAIAEQYLRVPVAYHGAVYRHSLVDGRQVGPRLWHRDAEDRRVLRTVLYLNDVAEAGGPFEYVPRSIPAAAYKALSVRGQCDDDEMAAQVPRDRWKRCIGPAGTVVITDSAQVFHHESLQRRSDRSVVMMGHSSRQPTDRALAEAHFPAQLHVPALVRITRPEHRAHVFGWRQLGAQAAEVRAPAAPASGFILG